MRPVGGGASPQRLNRLLDRVSPPAGPPQQDRKHVAGPGVRLDTHAYPGYTVSPYYDSLIAKLVVHKPTRQEAIQCIRRALEEFHIDGIKTTIPLYAQVFQNRRFVDGHFDTGFIDSLFLG